MRSCYLWPIQHVCAVATCELWPIQHVCAAATCGPYSMYARLLPVATARHRTARQTKTQHVNPARVSSLWRNRLETSTARQTITQHVNPGCAPSLSRMCNVFRVSGEIVRRRPHSHVTQMRQPHVAWRNRLEKSTLLRDTNETLPRGVQRHGWWRDGNSVAKPEDQSANKCHTHATRGGNYPRRRKSGRIIPSLRQKGGLRE